MIQEKQEKQNKPQIGHSAYESPRVERVQVKTEGCFAASQSVKDMNGVKIDGWIKTVGDVQSSNVVIDSWTKE